MAKPSQLNSTNAESNSTKQDLQDSNVAKIAARVRERAKALNFNAKTLGQAVGIPSSTVSNYWNGKRSWPSEVMAALSDTLRTNVDSLLRDRGNDRRFLSDVADADWTAIPEYVLRDVDEAGKPESIATTMMRRDWLNRTLGFDTGLWLTALPCDYQPLGLSEGDQVFCRDISREQLRERYLCIWRMPLTGELLVARSTIVHRGNHVLVEEGGEYWVNPHLIEGFDLVPIGRVVGRPVASIR